MAQARSERWREGSRLLEQKRGIGDSDSIDLEIDAMDSGVVAAGGEIADDLGFSEGDGCVWRQREVGPFKDFFCGVAAGFDVMDHIIDDQRLWVRGGGGEGGVQGETAAEREDGG